MPIRIDVQTNFQEHELTIESCSQIIEMLQLSYQNIRKEMYNYFLDFKHLKKAIIFSVFLGFLYFVTKDIFCVYMMPISVLLSMITSVISAEYLTSQTRKQIMNQINHFIETREKLLRKQNMGI